MTNASGSHQKPLAVVGTCSPLPKLRAVLKFSDLRLSASPFPSVKTLTSDNQSTVGEVILVISLVNGHDSILQCYLSRLHDPKFASFSSPVTGASDSCVTGSKVALNRLQKYFSH